MQVEYLYSIGSHTWTKLPEENGNFYSSILALLYTFLIDEKRGYTLEVRVTISDPEVQKNISEDKKYTFESLLEVSEFMSSLKHLISEPYPVDIFYFNSNDDMSFFREWAKERDNRLNSELESYKKI